MEKPLYPVMSLYGVGFDRVALLVFFFQSEAGYYEWSLIQDHDKRLFVEII